MKAGETYIYNNDAWRKCVAEFAHNNCCKYLSEKKIMTNWLDQSLGIPHGLGVVYTYYLPTNAVLYVGKSSNMKNRVIGHLQDALWIEGVDHMSFTVCEKENMDELEIQTIVRALIDWPETIQNIQVYIRPNDIIDVINHNCLKENTEPRLPWWTSDEVQNYEIDYNAVHTTGTELFENDKLEKFYAAYRDENPWG